MIENLLLPKTLKDLSTTIDKSIPLDSWSGAVNMILIDEFMIFIKRSQDMPTHKGQMGFMGGHKHAGETEPLVTALREFNEETSLSSDILEPIGLIEPAYTANGKLIIPLLSRSKISAEEFLETVVPNEEWDELILTPLDYLCDVNNWVIGEVNDFKHRKIGFCPLRAPGALTYPQNTAAEFLLWGASAKMVWNFFKCYE